MSITTPADDLRREPRGRLDLVEPLAERAHDPPPADVRPAGNREARGDLHPGRDVEVVDRAVREQRERDHAHRLLRVVRAVREGDERPRDELAEPEAAVARARRDALEDPEDRDQQDERAAERNRRREERGDHDLVREPVPLHALRRRLAIAAPTRPPISACEELDGSPSHHVRRFHAIAPIRAASTSLRGREVACR